jgi:3-(3-hydroxy-phenyl)propionate hydroxylase
MRSWRPFCCGWPGLMRAIAMPSRSHQTESFERLNKALGLAKGTPLSERMASGRPRSRNSLSKAVIAGSSRVGKTIFLADGPDWRLVLKIPFGPGPNDWVTRLVSSLAPGISEEEVSDPAFLQKRFDGLVEGRTAPFPIRDYYIYNVHKRAASSFRVGRILLAGDAAHINNPLGGQGLNCGIHDAVNLAAKLGAVWRSEAEPELLDLYDRQRRLTNTEYIQKVSIENKERQEETDLAKRAAGMDFMELLARDDDMRVGFLKRWTMIDSLAYANSIA